LLPQSIAVRLLTHSGKDVEIQPIQVQSAGCANAGRSAGDDDSFLRRHWQILPLNK
jgi:hypothetical protein